MGKDSHKHDRTASLLGHLSAEFFAREAFPHSLITITDVTLSKDRKYATIFFTSFPEGREKEVSDFMRRSIGALCEFFENHARMGRVPFIKIVLDRGEKNRQQVETWSSKN